MFADQRHRLLMSFRAVGGCGAVFDKSDVVVEHEADAQRMKHAHAGADAGHDQAFDAARPQQHVEIAAEECAIAVLGHDHLARSRF